MPGGRPTVMTDEVIRKLEEAFMLGCTDLEACFAADIGKTALYEYCGENPEFAERKEALKQNPIWRARRVLLDALDDKDVSTAHKIIDRKEGSKVAVSGPTGEPIQINITGFSSVSG